MSLGEQLKSLRKRAKVTQDELAEAIDVKRLSIIHWENDHTEPSAKNLKSLSDFFKVDVLSLVGGEKKQFPKGTKKKNAYAVFSGLLHLVWGLKDSATDPIMEDALKELEEKIRGIMSERFTN